MRWVTVVLAALLLLVQADLWLGRSSLPYVMALQSQLDGQRATNDAARQRNERLEAEVADLKEGLEMVEEQARSELGMVKPDELLVQVTRGPLPAPPAVVVSPAPPAVVVSPAPPAVVVSPAPPAVVVSPAPPAAASR